jgi:hypothetical protein
MPRSKGTARMYSGPSKTKRVIDISDDDEPPAKTQKTEEKPKVSEEVTFAVGITLKENLYYEEARYYVAFINLNEASDLEREILYGLPSCEILDFTKGKIGYGTSASLGIWILLHKLGLLELRDRLSELTGLDEDCEALSQLTSKSKAGEWKNFIQQGESISLNETLKSNPRKLSGISIMEIAHGTEEKTESDSNSD